MQKNAVNAVFHMYRLIGAKVRIYFTGRTFLRNKKGSDKPQPARTFSFLCMNKSITFLS